MKNCIKLYEAHIHWWERELPTSRVEYYTGRTVKEAQGKFKRYRIKKLIDELGNNFAYTFTEIKLPRYRVYVRPLE